MKPSPALMVRAAAAVLLFFCWHYAFTEPLDPGTVYSKGRQIYQNGLKAKNLTMFSQAGNVFQGLLRRNPHDGRAWLGAALVRLASAQTAGTLDRKEWDARIEPWIDRAMKEDPGSAWMAYSTSRILLTQGNFLTAEEKKAAFTRLRKSILMRDPRQVSPYLRPALHFIWKHYPDFPLLKQLTPPDIYSYEVLLEFMEQKGLWQYRENIEEQYLAWNRKVYEDWMKEAGRAMAGRHYARAFDAFQNAFYRNNTAMAARAGMIAAEIRRGKMPDENALRLVLEQADDPEAFRYFSGLNIDSLAEDPYLKGLFELRGGRPEKACGYFKKTERDSSHPSLRRFYAEACGQIPAEKKGAVEYLKRALQDKNPDARELLLLARLDPESKPAAEEKLIQAAPKQIPPASWWTIADSPARQRVQVNLIPGRTVFRLKLRGPFPGNGAYVKAELWEDNRMKPLGRIYLKSDAWQNAVFETSTSGGKRWLDLVVQNPAKHLPLEIGETALAAAS